MSSPTLQHTVISDELLFALHTFMARLTAADPPPQMNASGTYDTIIGATLLDCDVVADALPDGMSLQPDLHTPIGKHPILLTLGRQSGVTVKDLPGVMNYNEAIVAIPNVQVEGYEANGLAVYPARIEVDDPIALILGWAIGLPKELCYISAAATSYQVSALLSRSEILSESCVILKGGTHVGDFPNFQYVAGLMRQPVVSKDAAGSFLFAGFHWNFEAAELQQTTVHVKLDEDLPALPAGEYQFHGFGSRALGSGRLCVHWDICGPFHGWPPPSVM
jgi:hypothetical protein